MKSNEPKTYGACVATHNCIFVPFGMTGIARKCSNKYFEFIPDDKEYCDHSLFFTRDELSFGHISHLVK